ncbi:lysophospholipid acyltransferase family protein [bacterium]
MKSRIYAFLAHIIITLLSKTLRLRKYNTENYEKIKQTGKNVIYCFWHGTQFILVYSHRNRNVNIMSSLSKDGDIQAGIMKSFNYNVIRGSSTKGGPKATRQILRELNKGNDTAFAVDGPRGPIYEAKMGVIFLAAMTGSVLLPVAASCKNAWIFEKAWDKYVLPKPFTKAAYMYGEPIVVEKKDDFEQKRFELDNALKLLREELDKRIKNH